jgi:AraC-like DNA-binding protein
VPHDGRAATAGGFRKRVLYLDGSTLDDRFIGTAATDPSLDDPPLRRRLHELHACLTEPGETLQAQSRFALIRERLVRHLRSDSRSNGCTDTDAPGSPRLATQLRELLDAHVVAGVALAEAARELGAHPVHLVRAFTAAYGVPPHAYLTGRRIDLARRLLLSGQTAARTAVLAGFYDQAHLTRHFRRYLGTTPSRFAGGLAAGGIAARHSQRTGPSPSSETPSWHANRN